MIIELNKNKQELNLKTHVWNIIETAKQNAEKGIDTFYYPIPRHQGFSHWQLIDEVENITKESVYAGYKSVSNGVIKFSIRS